jgi:hypothetical protein
MIAEQNWEGESNIMWDADPAKGYRKGEDVLLDALLLAHADFLISSASAVSEFAVYFNPSLGGASMLNVQYYCGHPKTHLNEDHGGCLPNRHPDALESTKQELDLLKVLTRSGEADAAAAAAAAKLMKEIQVKTSIQSRNCGMCS